MGFRRISYKRYFNKIDQITEVIRTDLVKKEIYIVYARELAKYLDPKITFYKPSRSTIDIFSPKSVKKSTRDIINVMINKKFLIWIESLKLLLLKEKMKCVKCSGEIDFQDKIEYVEAKSKDCSL